MKIKLRKYLEYDSNKMIELNIFLKLCKYCIVIDYNLGNLRKMRKWNKAGHLLSSASNLALFSLASLIFISNSSTWSSFLRLQFCAATLFLPRLLQDRNIYICLHIGTIYKVIALTKYLWMQLADKRLTAQSLFAHQ